MASSTTAGLCAIREDANNDMLLIWTNSEARRDRHRLCRRIEIIATADSCFITRPILIAVRTANNESMYGVSTRNLAG